MKIRRKTVSWMDWEEWLWVSSNLFSNTRYLQEAAIRRIAVWRLRGKLPLAIESTARIVELQLQDSDWNLNGAQGIRSVEELRMSYALIVIRTVNGLVDTVQKGNFASSVSSLARQV